MALQVVKQDGKKSDRNVTLSDAIYAIEPNDHAIWLDVKSYLANQRQGTHKSKQRNEISGSSKKIKKQKGTGGARAGNIKNPQFKGGGRIFGPTPRDYSFKLNKKVKDLARRSALTYKAKDNAIAILEDLNFDKPQTKQFVKLIDSLSLNNKKTLFVIPEANRNISLSGRNVGKAKVITASQINTYDVINADQLVLVEGAVSRIDSLLTEKQ